MQSTSPQFAPRHTVQDCISGKSMATCVDLIDSGFKPNLPPQRKRTSTSQPSVCGSDRNSNAFILKLILALIIDVGNLPPPNNRSYEGSAFGVSSTPQVKTSFRVQLRNYKKFYCSGVLARSWDFVSKPLALI